MAGIEKALVTGGSRGIGFAIAKILVEHGIDVCIVGRDGARLEDAINRMDCNSAQVYPVVADLLSPAAPQQLVEQSVGLLGGIDLVVNNAGISLNCPFEETTFEQWEQMLTINARAPYFICQEALSHLRKSAVPTIVQIASVVSYDGYAMQSAYAASKHALVGFTKSLAREVAEEGIRIHTISPGGVATEMISSVRPDIDTNALIDPDEIASLVWFLISQRGNAMIDHVSVRRANKTPWS